MPGTSSRPLTLLVLLLAALLGAAAAAAPARPAPAPASAEPKVGVALYELLNPTDKNLPGICLGNGDVTPMLAVANGTCVKIPEEDTFFEVTCESRNSSSAWRLRTFDNSSCDESSLIIGLDSSGNKCPYAVDTIISAVAAQVNCGGPDLPALFPPSGSAKHFAVSALLPYSTVITRAENNKCTTSNADYGLNGSSIVTCESASASSKWQVIGFDESDCTGSSSSVYYGAGEGCIQDSFVCVSCNGSASIPGADIDDDSLTLTTTDKALIGAGAALLLLAAFAVYYTRCRRRSEEESAVSHAGLLGGDAAGRSPSAAF